MTRLEEENFFIFLAPCFNVNGALVRVHGFQFFSRGEWEGSFTWILLDVKLMSNCKEGLLTYYSRTSLQ